MHFGAWPRNICIDLRLFGVRAGTTLATREVNLSMEQGLGLVWCGN